MRVRSRLAKPRRNVEGRATMTSNIAANLRHIAKHEAKPQPKELPYTQITRGFEAFAFPKIVSKRRPRRRNRCLGPN